VDPPAGRGYFARRWRGEVPAPVLLWRDMLLVGTVLNLVATFTALMLIAQGVPTPWAVALHFAPVPYNVFLFAALGRAPQRTPLAMGLAAVWLAVMTLV
jgi:hypothetical protein